MGIDNGKRKNFYYQKAFSSSTMASDRIAWKRLDIVVITARLTSNGAVRRREKNLTFDHLNDFETYTFVV